MNGRKNLHSMSCRALKLTCYTFILLWNERVAICSRSQSQTWCSAQVAGANKLEPVQGHNAQRCRKCASKLELVQGRRPVGAQKNTGLAPPTVFSRDGEAFSVGRAQGSPPHHQA